jgi:hypothetical protein
MKKKLQGERVLARITLYGVGTMKPKDRRKLAGWLRRSAEAVEIDGHQYSDKRFVARLYEAREW